MHSSLINHQYTNGLLDDGKDTVLAVRPGADALRVCVCVCVCVCGGALLDELWLMVWLLF